MTKRRESVPSLIQMYVGTVSNNYFLDSKQESGIKQQTTQGNIFNTELSKMKEKKKTLL